MKARDYFPAVKYGAKWYPEDIVGGAFMNDTNNYWFVDGDKSANGGGKSWEDAFADLESAVNNASLTAGDTIFVAARTMAKTDTDPISYTENAVLDTPSVSIIGVSRGRTQGGLPQLKVGATTTQAILTIQAPGCLISNLGFNGKGATGGGILLDDDGGTTSAAFGWTIANCHFKNCVGTDSTDAETGGAIQWSGDGGAWQGLVTGCRFYKNTGDITLPDGASTIPQDIVIENCEFSGPIASTDCNIYTGTGGINGLVIRDCTFSARPNMTSAETARYVQLTGSVGIMANCYFAHICDTTGTEGTFAAAGTYGIVPATMYIVGCKGETTTADKAGEIIRT